MLGGLRSGQNQALDQPVACIQRCRRVLGRPLISFTVRPVETGMPINFNISVSQPDQRRLFDPSSIGDPVAGQTQWEPLKSGGTNYRSHKIRMPNSSRLEFRVAISAFLFYFIAVLIGLTLMGSASVNKLPAGGSAFHVRDVTLFVVGVVVAVLGACLVYSGTAPIVFDKRNGYFWKGRRVSRALSASMPLKNVAKLDDVHALQLLSKYISSTHSGSEGSYYSFELNLVLKDGERINVVDHGDLTRMRADVATLSAFLGKPIWDLAS
jgi:hypothetical protein